jgi:PilZ domain
MPKKMSAVEGALTRELSVRVINISGSGCLVESQRRLEVGTIGKLRLQLGVEECGDDIEVVRCETVEGARSIYHVGMRFLLTTPRNPGSIRYAVSRHAAGLALQLPPTRLM